MTKVFVTGFDGYVGQSVVSALRARGVGVRALVRDEKGSAKARAAGVEPFLAGLEDGPKLEAIAREVDAIAHLAASDNPAFLPLSRRATDAMIAGLAPGKPFLMQGGSMVFGDTTVAGVGELPAFNPPPPLAERAGFEQDVLARSKTGVRTHIVYGSLVFGGRGAMIPNVLVSAAAKVGASGYAADGSAVWSAVHIDDWADLIVRVLLDGKTSGKAVFAAAQDITMRGAAEAVAAAFMPALPVRAVTGPEAFDLWSFFGPGFALSQKFDGKAARRDYGWSPAQRDLASEMKRLVPAPS